MQRGQVRRGHQRAHRRHLRRRVLQHEPKFWFKKPIVESASFIPIKDTKLRQRVEEALIFFLRSNAVVNDLGTNH